MDTNDCRYIAGLKFLFFRDLMFVFTRDFVDLLLPMCIASYCTKFSHYVSNFSLENY